MEPLTADNAKKHFGELLLKAQREPVQISRNGKAVAVVISMAEYDAIDKIKLELLRLRATEAAQAAELVDVDTVFAELLQDF
jgi:prevent-host-death family protein